MADALAVKVDIGLCGHADIGDLLGSHSLILNDGPQSH